MTTLTNFQYLSGEVIFPEHIHKLIAASLRAEYRNVETLSANRTLVDLDTPVQVLTASGAARDVTLPAVGTDNHPFMVTNAGSTYNLVIKNAGGTVIATVTPGTVRLILASGTEWYAIGKNDSEIDHTVLKNIGANSHATLDTFLSNSGATDGQTIKSRLHLNKSPTDMLNSLPALTWASYAGFVTPTTDIASFPSNLLIYKSGGSAGNTKMFGYLGSYYSTFRALCVPGLDNCRSGVRIDDGTNNNYVEIFLEIQTSGLLKLRNRTCAGGVVTGPTDLWSSLVFPSQYYWLVIATGGGVAYSGAGLNAIFSPPAASLAIGWTPTRSGIFAEHPSGGTVDAQRAACFDALQYS